MFVVTRSRYHDIEFQQFKKDFDCPACLNKCNCTACCDKRKEVYITTRHIKFDRETMAKILSGEIRSLPHLSASFAGFRKRPSNRGDPPSTARKSRTSIRKKILSRQDTDNDDYAECSTAKDQTASLRENPSKSASQTRRMLEESGGGRYWGAVYSLNGKRIGMSYVGNNLQNVTVQTANRPLASITAHPRRHAFVGKWQDAWGSPPETLDDSHSEDEPRANQRNRNNKGLTRSRIQYVGNHNVIVAWRKAQSKAVPSPHVVSLPTSDGVHIHIPPSDSALDGKACDWDDATDSVLGGNIPFIGDEDDSGSYWTMEAPEAGQDENCDVHSTSTLEPRQQLVTQLVAQDVLAATVASSLEAVGTTVFLSGGSLSLPIPSC